LGKHAVNEHEPALQAAPVVFGRALHETPHFPQLATFVRGSAHAPAQQSEPEPGHTVPQPLQLSGSDFVSRQSPLQHVAVPVHVPAPTPVHPSTHAPAGLHFLPPVQSVSTAQLTHWCRPRLQNGAVGLSAAHSALLLQPGAHSLVGRQ
jgi:hypothetical protein